MISENEGWKTKQEIDLFRLGYWYGLKLKYSWSVRQVQEKRPDLFTNTNQVETFLNGMEDGTKGDRFRLEMMVKQWIGEVQGAHAKFRVYATGNPKYVLFCPLDSYGCEGGLQFPVKRADLKRGVLPK